MKRRSLSAFTLVEMLMVMVIISILSALVLGVAVYANKKAARSKAESTIRALSAACESYKVDNGAYPRLPNNSGGTVYKGGTEQLTDGEDSPIDPRLHADPTTDGYKSSSLFLYKVLSGDYNADGRPGDIASGDTVASKIYFEFKGDILGGVSTTTPVGTADVVKYLQDPFGFSYGYSTAGAKAEDDYRTTAATANGTGSVARSAKLHGYNPTFDLWSTGGTKITQAPTDESRQRWVKNW